MRRSVPRVTFNPLSPPPSLLTHLTGVFKNKLRNIRMRDEGDSDRCVERFISGNRSLARKRLFFREASVAIALCGSKKKIELRLLISKKEKNQ